MRKFLKVGSVIVFPPSLAIFVASVLFQGQAASDVMLHGCPQEAQDFDAFGQRWLVEPSLPWDPGERRVAVDRTSYSAATVITSDGGRFEAKRSGSDDDGLRRMGCSIK